MIRTVIATTGALLLWCGAVIAEPMKCSGEQQACVKICAQVIDPTRQRACITSCSQRLAACRQTGCWNNGSSNYCGLLRQ